MTRPHSPDARCLNCDSPMRGGRFCSACGQEHLLEAYSLRVMAGHFFGELFSLDSKVVRSVVPLVTRPGRLTIEYRNGRRTHFVRPLRLYLAASLLFFLVVSVAGNETGMFTFGDGSGDREPVTAEGLSALADSVRAARALRDAPSPADTLAIAADGPDTTNGTDATTGTDGTNGTDATTGTDGADASDVASDDDRWLTLDVEEIADVPLIGRLLANRVNRANELGQEATINLISVGISRELSRTFFLMVPLFALVLQLLYIRQRRYYVEHLVFLLHLQAFYFLLASVVVLVRFDPVKVIAMVGAFVYLYKAVRNVYGQGRFRSIWKSVVLVNGSFALILVGTIVATIVSVLTL